MKVYFDWAEFNIKFDLNNLGRSDKLNLVNTILHQANIELTEEQIKKLDEWIDTTNQTKS